MHRPSAAWAGLLGSNWLYLLDMAKKNVLQPNATVIPAAATLYCAGIEARTGDVAGFDFSAFNKYRCGLAPNIFVAHARRGCSVVCNARVHGQTGALLIHVPGGTRTTQRATCRTCRTAGSPARPGCLSTSSTACARAAAARTSCAWRCRSLVCTWGLARKDASFWVSGATYACMHDRRILGWMSCAPDRRVSSTTCTAVGPHAPG